MKMNRSLALILLASLTTLAPLALNAQEAGSAVKVTTTLHSDGTQTVLKTDPDSHTAESTLLDASQKVLQRTVYALDDQGQFTNASIYDGQGKLVYKSTYTRDESNHLKEQVDTTADDKVVRKLTFEYNNLGKLVRVRSFDATGNETTPQSSGARHRK